MKSDKTVPNFKGDMLLGNLRQLKAGPFQALCDWQRDHGDPVGFRIATRQFYLLSHPELVAQALIQQSGVFVKMYDPGKPRGLARVAPGLKWLSRCAPKAALPFG